MKTTREGMRCPGHQIFVSGNPPVTGTALMIVSSGPSNPPVLSAGSMMVHGVMPAHSSLTMTIMPEGTLCTAMTLAFGAVGGSGFGGSGAVAQPASRTAA